jgi:hypothetical protein
LVSIVRWRRMDERASGLPRHRDTPSERRVGDMPRPLTIRVSWHSNGRCMNVTGPGGRVWGGVEQPCWG